MQNVELESDYLQRHVEDSVHHDLGPHDDRETQVAT
jgi:hypothetical protein